MTNNSFFAEFEWKDRVCGMGVSCNSSMVYSLDCPESIDKLIADACKILRQDDATVTFQCFTGYETIDLLRLMRDYNGALDMVTWRRNSKGFLVETNIERGSKMTRPNIKRYIFRAIELFRNTEAA